MNAFPQPHAPRPEPAQAVRSPCLALRGLPAAVALALAGCGSLPFELQRLMPRQVLPDIRSELPGPEPSASATVSAQAAAPPDKPASRAPTPAAALAAVDQAGGLPAAGRKDARFDLTVSNVNPAALFAAIAHDSRLSVLVDPAIKGSFTVSLKDVSVNEALEALQELYGFEYKVLGRKLVVQAPEPQTRVFKVSYPVINRSGRSEVRVVSGSMNQGGGGTGSNSGSTTNNNANAGNANGGGGGGGGGMESSRVSTSQRSDVWAEIESAVKLLAPDKDGTQVVVSPQTGTIIVRAMPATLRAVERYLDAAKLQVERQVMIEAKIIEVSLNDGASSGINWAAFKNSLSAKASLGLVGPGTTLAVNGPLVAGSLSALPGTTLASAAAIGGGLFGLAFQTSNFAAVVSFLETQGSLQVLSSPRIATLNNQKAVLKVGSDDFFVTNISTTTSSTGNSSTTSPTISVQPFFSGISLDVTPQIDESGHIILHVHPQVTTVKERAKVLNLGALGTFTLPLASSSVNESDSIVRVSNGSIFAIGGLMRQEQSDDRSGVPGTSNTLLRSVLGQSSKASSKQELVILLKPSVIVNGEQSEQIRGTSLARMLAWLDETP